MLALMMLLTPALGAPTTLMLQQDTLKSAIVATFALTAALMFLVRVPAAGAPPRWHWMLCLPLGLCAYALGSMAWSHAYLAGVETVRWFLFALIAWVGLNALKRERLPMLAMAIHVGAVVAALWAALQFWVAFDFFAEGRTPSSTFTNRNFFAEFAVCTLPFAGLLLTRCRTAVGVALLAISSGLIAATVLMTGTRSALIALWLLLIVVLPLIAWCCRGQLAFRGWSMGLKLLAPAAFFGTLLVLSALPSANPLILEEGRGSTGLARGFARTQSIGPSDPSLGTRMDMWRDTVRAIAARPLTGLGAGAWESEIPLYQSGEALVETDYYAHNEFLQLVAEYGLVGWFFLMLLLAYLLRSAWRTWHADGDEAREDWPWRAVLLASLFALLIVSAVGFPWRLATTGALFALCLGALMASDVRMRPPLDSTLGPLIWPRPWSPALVLVAVVATVACMIVGLYIGLRATMAEHKLMWAARVAGGITAAGGDHGAMASSKAEMLRLVHEGVLANPHYRKITPVVADELARWGDWHNALWIWESVLESRPHVVAILTNAARGYSALGRSEQARTYLERARAIRPHAPAVWSLEVLLLARAGREVEAIAMGRQVLDRGVQDFDLVNTLFVLGRRAGDLDLAEQAGLLRIEMWPQGRALAWAQLGDFYACDARDDVRATEAFRNAVSLVPAELMPALLREIPAGHGGDRTSWPCPAPTRCDCRTGS